MSNDESFTKHTTYGFCFISSVDTGNTGSFEAVSISKTNLLFLVEFVYLKDIFHAANPPYFRTYTVFKIYYEVFNFLGFFFVRN